MSAVAVERATEFVPDLIVKQLEPNIGAEISGIDLRQPLSTAHRDHIKALLLKHRAPGIQDQERRLA